MLASPVLTGLCVSYNFSLWAWMGILNSSTHRRALWIPGRLKESTSVRCVTSLFALLKCAASLLMCDSRRLYPSMWLPWRLDPCSPASIRRCIDPRWSPWHSPWAVNSLTRGLGLTKTFSYFLLCLCFSWILVFLQSFVFWDISCPRSLTFCRPREPWWTETGLWVAYFWIKWDAMHSCM